MLSLLVLDGVFTDGEGDTLRFRPLPPPADDEVGGVLATIYTRVCRLLRRRGFDASAADLSRPDAPRHAHIAGFDLQA